MKQKLTFFLYLIVLILPNLILCVTESMPLLGKLTMLLLPLGAYWCILTLSYRLSRTMLYMFPVLFLGAFNIVLSYLFGKGVIAVAGESRIGMLLCVVLLCDIQSLKTSRLGVCANSGVVSLS